MIYRRRRHCINDNMCCNPNLIENACENICKPIECDYDNENTECGFDEEQNVFPENPSLAQSYVPIQYAENIFKPCTGLKKGTIFPELVSPYNPGDSMKEIEFLRNSSTIGEGANQNGR